MGRDRQELMQVARHKLERGQYSVEQRELILHTLDLLLEMAQAGEKNEETARSAAMLFSNITNHHNLVAIIQQQVSELNAFKRITFNLTTSLQMQVILEAIVREAMHLVKKGRDTHIYLYQDDLLKFGASLDSNGHRNLIDSVPRPDGLTYMVARSRQTVLVEDTDNNPLFSDLKLNWSGSIIGIPIMTGGAIVGVMIMSRWLKGGFLPSELRLLALLADQAALAIMNAHLHEEMANQAMSDSLTSLPNRRALDARLEDDVQRSIRYKRQFGVLMMDLDGFKGINDTYGHGVGDQVLRQFAQFMASQQRASDFLARYGGDELLLILPETSPEAAQLVAQHIRERLSGLEFSFPDGSKRFLGVSGGISIFPLHATTASELLRAADEALYRAKRLARGTFLMADEHADTQIQVNQRT